MKRPKYGNKDAMNKWIWVHERKHKSTPIEQPIPNHVCVCGCQYVNKYRAQYYCRSCGALMNKSKVEKRLAQQRRMTMNKVIYISIYHFCRTGQDAEYHVQFNRGKDPAKTPRYNKPTKSSLKRVAKLFYYLEYMQPSFQTNFVNLQAYTKGE